jgi:hypothetical protein
MTPSPSAPDSQSYDRGLSTLPDEIVPPPDLEDAVVAGLARHGLLHGGPRRLRWWPLVAAAILGVTGYAVGRWTARPELSTEGARFVLLLEETPATSPRSPEMLERQIDANREWARGLAAGGQLILAEKLGARGYAVVADSGGVQVSDSPDAEALGGFFVIQAATLEDALAVARGAPHVAYGGRIVVRPVDPT